MKHDATHCLDYKKSCPNSCCRRQLADELKKTYYPLYVNYAHLEGTVFCPKMKTVTDTNVGGKCKNDFKEKYYG